jgi:hypothetical protein
MECSIEIIINGVKKTLHSDEALDAYIFKRRDALQDLLNVVDPTFSASSAVENTITKLNEVKKEMSKKDTETKQVRVTEALQYLIKQPVFEDFDEDAYRAEFDRQLLEKNPTLTKKELDDLFENPRTLYSDMGTDVHYGIETFFTKEPLNISKLKKLSKEKVNVARTKIGSKIIDHLNTSFGKEKDGTPK